MVEEDDKFAHAGHESDVLQLIRSHEPIVERFQDRVESARYEGGHVEHPAHLDATAASGAASAVRAAALFVGRGVVRSEARCQGIERHAGTARRPVKLDPLKRKRLGNGGARCG